MPQIRVRPSQVVAGHFELDGTQAHHLVNVLRRKPGDEVLLFDGEGRRHQARIDRAVARPAAVAGTILSTVTLASRAARWTLCQGLPRGAKMDFVIEKAVELGVDEILPFFSRKNPVSAEGAGASRLDRWRRLAEAASEQSLRPTVPSVLPPVPFESLIDTVRSGHTLFLSPVAEKTLLQTAPEWRTALRVVIVVGPESGFDETEVTRLLEWGATPVRLGPRVLRTETAGMAALSALGYEQEG